MFFRISYLVDKIYFSVGKTYDKYSAALVFNLDQALEVVTMRFIRFSELLKY